MTIPLRALVIDDERLARKGLIDLLVNHPSITVSGEAYDVPSAIKQIKKLNPDVIFLDIQMPGESGFDLLDQFDVQAKIVFVTAYDKYAIRAFEVNALDYLMKPVNPARLAKTVEKLTGESESQFQNHKRWEPEDRIFLQFNMQMRFIRINSILAIQAEGDYTKVKLDSGDSGYVLRTLKDWESSLPEKQFRRIHRSTIINLDYVVRTEKLSASSIQVVLKGVNEAFPISRRNAARFRKELPSLFGQPAKKNSL